LLKIVKEFAYVEFFNKKVEDFWIFSIFALYLYIEKVETLQGLVKGSSFSYPIPLT